MWDFEGLTRLPELMLDASGLRSGLAYFFRLRFSARDETTVSSCYLLFDESGLSGSRLVLNLFGLWVGGGGGLVNW